MTHEGRQILYRVGIRCMQEWAVEVAKIENGAAPVRLGFGSEPFGYFSWIDAIQIVDDLMNGRRVAKLKARG